MVLVQTKFRSIVYSHISFEPPMSTSQGIDHAPYVVGSVRNQAQQLLRRRTTFTRWMWHKTWQTFSWYPSWRNFESDCDGFRTSRSHLNHRCQRYKVSIMLKKSRSPRSSMEGFCPWKELLSISWFEQLKSLVWWESKRNNCKILVHRRVNQEAMPIGTNRHLLRRRMTALLLPFTPPNAFDTMHWLERW